MTSPISCAAMKRLRLPSRALSTSATTRGARKRSWLPALPPPPFISRRQPLEVYRDEGAGQQNTAKRITGVLAGVGSL